MIRPQVQGGPGFKVTKLPDDGGWLAGARSPSRWVRQTDFANAEAVGYLADRLNRLGVEKELLELGASRATTVVIGDGPNAIVFDFAPEVQAGAEILARRGETIGWRSRVRRAAALGEGHRVPPPAGVDRSFRVQAGLGRGRGGHVPGRGEASCGEAEKLARNEARGSARRNSTRTVDP